MEKYVINKKMLRQLTVMNNHREPSQQVLDSLYAQMVLEVAIYQFQKSTVQLEIDAALIEGNKEHFATLVAKYNELVKKYQKGIHLTEQGFKYTLKFDE
ncbi:IDEAL domain-containing protein [Anaerobacillus alkaliphilus]|uniref:IDEAL domain-containing protein n=1 Tax=Anaerobacillus alkaliphilus TaxID=1548597 RepID=A0A4Q0VQU3_9BACI|nr:IDEAL domain-containing protein [Anaerobacillus alkaliphilus]RXI98355.1 IDEAL domain-containing protein [Anaerobacillus alkaliphilus]